MDAGKTAIEPEFLSQALSRAVMLRIGQMNKTEHEGVLRNVGRYEINVLEQGNTVTILKQDISFLSAPAPLITVPPPDIASSQSGSEAPSPGKPNIQQEFLDKAMRDRHVLTIFLLTGQRVKAALEAYDNFTILLREGDRQHLYYKHAISTINR